jgi:hypothetical protein
MRVPGVRFTVRTMIVAVAVVAGCFGVEAMKRRSRDFRDQAESHKREAGEIAIELSPDPDGRWEVFWFSKDPHPPEPARYSPTELRDWQVSKERRIAYHVMLYQKYRRAAARPWLPIEPDPPEPQ